MATKEHFLVCTNDYKRSSVGLFCNFECVDSYVCDNKIASKQLFTFIDELLKRNNLTLQECSFLAVNQGPGPFTTLRVIIASINGLAFATQKPLVGINSLETFVHEHGDTNYDYVVALNNAYGDDVYYAILNSRTSECISGCMSFEALITTINDLPSSTIKMIGGRAHEKRIELGERIKQKITFPEPCPEYASLDALGKQAYQQWLAQENVSSQATPLYLKNYSVKN